MNCLNSFAAWLICGEMIVMFALHLLKLENFQFSENFIKFLSGNHFLLKYHRRGKVGRGRVGGGRRNHHIFATLSALMPLISHQSGGSDTFQNQKKRVIYLEATSPHFKKLFHQCHSDMPTIFPHRFHISLLCRWGSTVITSKLPYINEAIYKNNAYILCVEILIKWQFIK